MVGDATEGVVRGKSGRHIVARWRGRLADGWEWSREMEDDVMKMIYGQASFWD